jgi:hypothetical protein
MGTANISKSLICFETNLKWKLYSKETSADMMQGNSGF